ncbi:SDR family NAD(P)-dependent oxidoreductase [Nonomuraea sp. CA-141351]|uniref:SDR family NAD(P)-dependent oxidoreductase n=1 Tax=Nonomuraea sp. CA-141351 TaxID=3239996 RepID=UPI003D94ED98
MTTTQQGIVPLARMPLSGKVAIVTGAGSGKGAASTATLAAQGARVYCADIDAECAEQTAEDIAAAKRPGCRWTLPRRTTTRWSTRRWPATAPCTWRTSTPGRGSGRVLDYPLEEWDRTIAVNLRGALLGLQAAVTTLI